MTVYSIPSKRLPASINWGTAERLPEGVRRLLRKPSIVGLQNEYPLYVESVLLSLRYHLDAAFDSGDSDSLLSLHRTLRHFYDLHFADDSGTSQPSLHPVLYDIQQKIEDRWIRYEHSRCSAVQNDYNCDPHTFVSSLKALVYNHRAAMHPLFAFLETEARFDQLCHFFASDYDLNMRFFDLIALASVGTTGVSRQELAQNLWDEAGCGDPTRAHTALFANLITTLNLKPLVERALRQPRYQSLAGYNLFAYLALHRRNVYMNQGNLAATELLDPLHYGKVLRGAHRLRIHEIAPLDYYSEHLTVDIKHGDGWLNNVIIPSVSAAPSARREIVMGVEMRLNTCADYYDSLLSEIRSIRVER